jgi:hypothetical protein
LLQFDLRLVLGFVPLFEGAEGHTVEASVVGLAVLLGEVRGVLLLHSLPQHRVV